VKLRGLAGNLALAFVSSTLFLAVLEGGSRLLEKPRPKDADFIVDWQKRWDGEFFTVGSGAQGFPTDEEFNRDGVRDRWHSVEKPEGVTRLLFLGDSVTLGQGISPAEAFPAQLQARLDEEGHPVEVFNVALWGWSIRQERIAWEKIARKYRPDHVVVAICLNDIPELQNNLARPPRWLTSLHERSALVRLVVRAQGREIDTTRDLFRHADSKAVRAGFERFFEEHQALQRDVEASGATYGLVVFPFRFQVEPGAPEPTVQRTILDFCKAQRIACLDLLPALARIGGERGFVDYDHVNPVGARIAAEQLLGSPLVPRLPSHIDTLGARQSAAGLREALGSPDARLRWAAAWALGRQRPAEPASSAALTKALSDGSAAVRREAAAALGRLGSRDAVPALFELLADPAEGVRAEAARSLHALHPQEADVPALIVALGNPDPYVRAFATFTLGELGPQAREAIPALTAALDGDLALGRAGAAMALAKMGPLARGAVPRLTRLVEQGEGRSWHAARALGRIGPDARAAVPALLKALAGNDALLRQHAAKALGRIDLDAPGVRSALQAAAGDTDDDVRREALAALEGR
jgi:HEAT repeat protein